MTEHLSNGTLLRYVDGELPRHSRKRAARHLESCWNCRAKLEQLEGDIGIIVEAQASGLASLLPPPPRHWRALNRKLEEVTGSQRLATTFPHGQRITVGGIVAVFSLVVFAVLWFFPARVTAKQVLEHLAATDDKRIQIHSRELLLQRVLIKRTEIPSLRQSTGVLDCWMLSGKVYWRATPASLAVTTLEKRAIQTRMGDFLPLSSAAYHAWFEKAGGSLDVQAVRSGQRIALIAKSAASTGGLQQVRIVVAMATWRADSMTLEFPNERYEVSEERLAVVPPDQAPREVLLSLESDANPMISHRQQAALLPRPPIPTGLPKRNLDDTELDVWWQLHRLHADLGEPIQVGADASRIIVNARGVLPERRAELNALLRDRKDVLLQFDRLADHRREASTTEVTRLPSHRLATAQALHKDDQRLTEFFGGFPQRETFTGLVLDREGRLQDHLYAVRNLAHRFDAAREAALSDTAKQRLKLLVRDHLEIATGELVSLQSTLDPLFRQFTNADQPVLQSETPINLGWQTCSNSVLTSINSADRSLRALLTTADASVSLEQASPAAKESLRQAETVLQYCIPKP